MSDNRFKDKYRIDTSRAEWHDYNGGVYFITICTENRACFFGVVTEGTDTQEIQLSESGIIADRGIREIPKHYPAVNVIQYCVMPNHVHILMELQDRDPRPTVSWVVNQYKGAVTRQIGRCVWQKGFHDRVVRNEQEFRTIWEYVRYNPAKWKTDGYYVAGRDAGG